jgi:hypothetical protein
LRRIGLAPPSLSFARVGLFARPSPTSRYSPSLPRRSACDRSAILSWGQALLQGFTHTSFWSPLGAATSHEVHAPSAYSARGVRSTRGCRPGTFRLQGFAPSCRFPPPSAFRVCFTPVTLLGFRPSGVSPSKEPRHLFGVRRALLAFSPTWPDAHGKRRSWAPPSRAPRTRGGACCASRAFGPPEVRTRRRPR